MLVIQWACLFDESTLDTHFLKNKSYESETFTGSNPDTTKNENVDKWNPPRDQKTVKFFHIMNNEGWRFNKAIFPLTLDEHKIGKFYNSEWIGPSEVRVTSGQHLGGHYFR